MESIWVTTCLRMSHIKFRTYGYNPLVACLPSDSIRFDSTLAPLVLVSPAQLHLGLLRDRHFFEIGLQPRNNTADNVTRQLWGLLQTTGPVAKGKMSGRQPRPTQK